MRTELWAAATAAVALIGGLAIGGAVAGDRDAHSSPPASGLESAQPALPQQVHYLFQDPKASSVERRSSRAPTRTDEESGDPRPHYDLRYRFICDPDGDWLIERNMRPMPGGKPQIVVYGFLLATAH